MLLNFKPWKRLFSTADKSLTCEEIRNTFLQYFISKDHHYLKSCPVFPHFDSSIPFINAGMCQFKRVFHDLEQIEHIKITNTQKCIRIAGKHNDLQVAGIDSYHHTFFEMLGNWSFGAYNEEHACRLAWTLLTSAPFKIPKHRLFVTYFEGNKTLKLPADNRIKEIWLELGVPKDHILPFGLTENFWEMGATGPCGTCTEIHVALTDELASSPNLVNKNHPLLTELWNIVFIRYNRSHDGSIESLAKQYIDTGMGFERLVAVLQGRISNYDTDVFAPLFKKISEVCQCPKYKGGFAGDDLDAAYRFLADFSRMVTVSISDNIFPDVNPKLKRILRKSLYIVENEFKQKDSHILIGELASVIADSLHHVFPEIGENLNQVKKVVENEANLMKILKSNKTKQWQEIVSIYPVLSEFSFTEYPGLVNGYQFLVNQIKENNFRSFLPPRIAVNLYIMFGLEKDVIQQLLQPFNLKVNWEEVGIELSRFKEKSKLQGPCVSNFSNSTDDSYKYLFDEIPSDKSFYTFPELNATILSVTENNDEQIDADSSRVKEIGIVTDKTNFYATAGGQCSDSGEIMLLGDEHRRKLNVHRVKKKIDDIIHYCYINQTSSENAVISFKAGDEVVMKIDSKKRCHIMRNHTAAHLLTAALKKVFPVSHFKNGCVTDELIESVFSVYGYSFNMTDCISIEKSVNHWITEALPVNSTVTSSTLGVMKLPNITFIPGEIYDPDNIRIISILNKNNNVISREPCCGTHLSNTRYIENFCITKMSFYKSASMLIIQAVTGEQAKISLLYEKDIKEKYDVIVKQADKALVADVPDVRKVIELNANLSNLIFESKYKMNRLKTVPCTSTGIFAELKILQKKVNKIVSSWPKEILITQLASTLSETAKKNDFIVEFIPLKHYILQDLNSLYELLMLVEIKSAKKIPSMYITYVSGCIRCFSYVPRNNVIETFTAETWLERVLKKDKNFKIGTKNNGSYVMMARKIPEDGISEYVDSVISEARCAVREFM